MIRAATLLAAIAVFAGVATASDGGSRRCGAPRRRSGVPVAAVQPRVVRSDRPCNIAQAEAHEPRAPARGEVVATATVDGATVVSRSGRLAVRLR